MSDLKYMQLEQAKDLAEIAQTGFDTSHITNSVHISNDPTRPSYGTAGSGNDFVFSEVGGAVNGFAGNDVLMGGNTGQFAFHGGTGNDTVAYINATQGATIALDPNLFGYPTLTNSGAAAGDTYDSIENVVGTKFADTIYGDAHNNKLYGGAGNDSINGGGGSDVINGGDGNDDIWGKLDGTDIVTGGDHKDANGNNVWGKDTFDFDIVGGQNFNLTITDFHPQLFNPTTSTAPTLAQALADPIHDVLNLTFEPSTGVATDAQADAAFVLTNGNPFQFVGHDVVLTVHTPYVDGTITLQGAADLVDSTHAFHVYDSAVHAV